jgi:hypothetical protein
VGQFSPAAENHFEGVDHQGSLFENSITTPAVADIDADGIPEIIALLYRDSLDEALIAVLDGQDMSLQAYAGVGRVNPNTAGIAVGNIDLSTPELEIATLKNGGGLITFRYDSATQTLTEWWTNDDGAISNIDSEAAPAIADIDGDGSPEVVFGFSVVDATGAIWQGINQGPAGGPGSHRANVAVVDMDQAVDANGQRSMELVAGNRVLKSDGTFLWDVSDTITDGYPAVGDFGDDGIPDVVTVTRGEVYVLSGTDGSIVFGPHAIPGGGQGGPPTIADFDGDGNPEFAAAGKGLYTVYDLDCAGNNPDPNLCASMRSDGILWTAAVQDLSSSRTGSSVFDFEGDGKAEVVYNDECFLRVFDGRDGTVLYERANSTRTGSEYPIVVDVDADFNAEIVVVSNNDQIGRDNCEQNYANYPPGGTSGVFTYGDASDNWVPTRQVWNQHSYHITNILEDGAVPAQEPIHYESSITNSFRLNVQPDGLFNAPDLVVEGIELINSVCSSEITVDVAVTVKNEGSQGVAAGVPVEVSVTHNGTTTVIGTTQTTGNLLPGARETVTITWVIPQQFIDDGFELKAIVDSTASTNECIEDNNDATYTPAGDDLAFGALSIQNLQVDDQSCGALTTLDVSLTVENQGNAPIASNVPIVVEAVRGSSREIITTFRTSTSLAAGATEQFQTPWTVSNTFFGGQFEIHATVDPDAAVEPCSSGATDTTPAACIPDG